MHEAQVPLISAEAAGPAQTNMDVEALEAGTLQFSPPLQTTPGSVPVEERTEKHKAKARKDVLDLLIERKDKEGPYVYMRDGMDKKNLQDSQVLELLIERLRHHASRMGSGIPEWEVVAQIGFLASELSEFQAQLGDGIPIVDYFVTKINDIQEFGQIPNHDQVSSFLEGVGEALSPQTDIALKDAEMYMNMFEKPLPEDIFSTPSSQPVVVCSAPGAEDCSPPSAEDCSAPGAEDCWAPGAKDAAQEETKDDGLNTAAKEVERVKNAVKDQYGTPTLIQHSPAIGYWNFGDFTGDAADPVGWTGKKSWSKDFTTFLKAFRHNGDAIMVQHHVSKGYWCFGTYKTGGKASWYPGHSWSKDWTTHLCTVTADSGQGIIVQINNNKGCWIFGKYDNQGSADWYGLNRWEANTTSHAVAFNHQKDVILVKHNAAPGRWWFGTYDNKGSVRWFKGLQMERDRTTHLVGFACDKQGTVLQYHKDTGKARFGAYDGNGGVSWFDELDWDEGFTHVDAFEFNEGVSVVLQNDATGLWKFGRYNGKGGVDWVTSKQWAKNYTAVLGIIPAVSLTKGKLEAAMLKQLKAELKEKGLSTYVGQSQGDPVEVLAGRLAYSKNKGEISSLRVFIDRWWEWKVQATLQEEDIKVVKKQCPVAQEFATVRLHTSLERFIQTYPVCSWYVAMLEDNLTKNYFGLLGLDSKFYKRPCPKDRALPFTVFGNCAKQLMNMQAIGGRSMDSFVPEFSEAVAKVHLVVLPEFILDATRLRAAICTQIEKSNQYRNKVLASMATGAIAGAQFMVGWVLKHG